MKFDHYNFGYKESNKIKRKNDVSGPEPVKVDEKWLALAKESHKKILAKRLNIK